MGMQTARILGIHDGQPREPGSAGASGPMERRWTSAIFEDPVQGPVWLSRSNLQGDAQMHL